MPRPDLRSDSGCGKAAAGAASLRPGLSQPDSGRSHPFHKSLSALVRNAERSDSFKGSERMLAAHFFVRLPPHAEEFMHAIQVQSAPPQNLQSICWMLITLFCSKKSAIIIESCTGLQCVGRMESGSHQDLQPQHSCSADPILIMLIDCISKQVICGWTTREGTQVQRVVTKRLRLTTSLSMHLKALDVPCAALLIAKGIVGRGRELRAASDGAVRASLRQALGEQFFLTVCRPGNVTKVTSIVLSKSNICFRAELDACIVNYSAQMSFF